MTKLNTLTKGLVGASVFSIFAAGNAFAGGTAAGTNVQNTFTLDYQVSGVDQPTIDTGPAGTNTPTEFTVDRLVDLTVASSGGTTVAPGAQDQELVFSVTNNGNDTQAYSFALVNEAGDDFDTTGLNITYYVDDGDGTFEPGADDGAGTAYTPGSGTPSDDILADRIVWVVVDGDIPASVSDADTSDISLIADTLGPVAGPDIGVPVSADTGGNTLTGVAENVLADGTGTANEVANAGDHSATATFTVNSPDITASKAVTVFSQDGTGCDTIPGTPGTDPLSVPGACVEYVITAINAGSIAATAIAINDTLPVELEYRTALVSATLTGGGFSQPTTGTDCSATACVVALTGATLAAGQTGTITIRALVQ